MNFQLKDTHRQELVDEIILYFEEEFDQQIGLLKAEIFLDSIVTKIGACIYNQAIANISTSIRAKLEDLEDTLDLPEN